MTAPTHNVIHEHSMPRLHRRRRLFSSISHARNIKKLATQDSQRTEGAKGRPLGLGDRGVVSRLFARPARRLIGLIKSIRCSTSLYAPWPTPDKSNNLTERSKGTYRPRKERRERGRGKQEWREKGKTARKEKETLNRGSLRGKPFSHVTYYFIFRDLNFNFCLVM